MERGETFLHALLLTSFLTFFQYIYIYIYTSFLGLFPSGSIIIPGELIRALPGDRRHEERTWRIKCWEEEEEEEFKAANLNRALLFFSTGQSLGAIKQKLTVSTGVNETRKGCGGMAATERGVGRGDSKIGFRGSDNRAEFEAKRLFYRGMMFLERLLPLF